MNLVFDIETNGFMFEAEVKIPNEETKKIETIEIPPADTIWCIVAMDDEGTIHGFRPHQIDEGLEFLKSADKLYGHNIIGFDLPIIKKLKGVDLYEHCEIVDTLTLSHLFNPNRGNKHGLRGWGEKLHYPKQEFYDFRKWSEKMYKYCINDVEINKKVLDILRKESVGFSKESIDLEHQVCRILAEQEHYGFLFDEVNATYLLSKLNKRKKEIEHAVHETFKPLETIQKITVLKNKDGSISKMGKLDNAKSKVRLSEEEYELFKSGKTSVQRKLLQDFNLGSRKQISERLKNVGWKPKRFTPTGQPIIDEKTLSVITHIKEAQLIAEFLLLQKRISQVKSWVDVIKYDNRIHGSVFSTGTITGRMTHYSPNMAQVPSVSSPYGKECRSCFIVPEGYKLVGIDASQLELRMLAHYMADEEYVNEIINGDIHTTNQKLARLESRDKAKTFIYALIYGAGDAKLGNIVGGSQREGKLLRERFFSGLPTFKSLKERVERAARKGYLKALDGRKVFIRNQHSALNFLLQSGGSLVMKKGVCLLDERLKLVGLDYNFVGNIHDEWQVEVKECQAHRVGELAVESLRDVQAAYNLRCPLDGEYKIGVNWSETH